MARRWRLNPPPNWPTLPDGWEPDRDWSPDPEWGPAPVGWTLWRRERRTAWLLRHRRSAGLGSAAALTIFVGLAGAPTSGMFTGSTPQAEAETADVPPGAGAMLVPRMPPERPQTEPVIRLERRAPAASRERRPAPRPAASVMVPLPTARGGRPVVRAPESEPQTGGTVGCAPRASPSGSTRPSPTTSSGVDRIANAGWSDDCPVEGEPGRGSSTPDPSASGSPDPSG